MKFIKDQIFKDKVPSLQYRGTVDGFSAGSYHQRCDEKANMVTIIRSDSGRVFGGFRSVPISNNNGWVQDQEAYIFSADDRQIFKVKSEEHSKAHFDQNNFGPIFGNDICIYTNS